MVRTFRDINKQHPFSVFFLSLCTLSDALNDYCTRVRIMVVGRWNVCAHHYTHEGVYVCALCVSLSGSV